MLILLRKALSYLSILVIFSINSGISEEKLKIVIAGIDDKEILTNAENSTLIYAYNGKVTPGNLRLQWLQDQANNQILNALLPFGYYQAAVVDASKKVGNEWVIYYHVTLGKPLKIDHLNLTIQGAGKRNRVLNRTLRKSKLKENIALNHETYEDTKNDLLDKATELGFYDASFEKNEILIDLEKYTSTVNLILDTGTRYTFGAVTYRDQYFDKALLQRFVRFDNQTNYSDEKMLNLQSDLSLSDYFDQIIISPKVNHEEKNVPMDIYLTNKKRRLFNLGLGYSTDIGFKTSTSMNWRYINPYGHKLKTEILWAQRKRDGIIQYTIPGNNPVLDSYNFYTKYLFEDTKYKDYTTLIAGTSIERKRDFYRYGLALDYQYDKFRDKESAEYETHLIIPMIFGEIKSRKNVRFGQTNYKIYAMLRGTSDALGSDASFLQAIIKADYYMPFGNNDRLILRGQLGHTKIGRKDLHLLPPSLRFYAGGDNSVRGYRLDGIGELGYKNNVVGGKKLAVASAEWEHQFIPNWAGAAFVDAGDAFNGNRPHFKLGAGIGVRWYSPIGSVRFDVAHGFNRLGDAFRLHLSIGADF